MDDLISRQAAIDAIKNQTCLTYEEIFNRCLTNIRDENGWVGGIKDAIEAVIGLPSVQPDWGKPVGDGRPLADGEVIARLQDIKKQIGGSYAIDRAIEMLKWLSSVQPTPCDVCRHNPPSSMDGKPCCICPAEGREG